jgi:hypothetical protein
MLTLPKIRSYGEYSSNNYGAHALQVEVGPLTVWFSYRTPVAFQVDNHNRVMLRNYWSTVTGKHLNWIDGGSRQAKKNRVVQEEFDRLWQEQVGPLLAGDVAETFLASMGV